MSVCFCSIFILIPLELRSNKNPITRAIMISIRSLLSNSTSYFWMNKFEWGHPVKHKASCCHILVQMLRTLLAFVLLESVGLDRPAIHLSNIVGCPYCGSLYLPASHRRSYSSLTLCFYIYN